MVIEIPENIYRISTVLNFKFVCIYMYMNVMEIILCFKN